MSGCKKFPEWPEVWLGHTSNCETQESLPYAKEMKEPVTRPLKSSQDAHPA
jgi:hypothetical protein